MVAQPFEGTAPVLPSKMALFEKNNTLLQPGFVAFVFASIADYFK
jgi:hypothetical protein